MSLQFSLSRLGKLITKQLFENSRLYIFSSLAIFGLLALIVSFWIVVAGPNYNEQSLSMIFFFGLFIAGSVFASMSFNMLGNKDKGIYWLSVPATHLEKLICTILYNTVFFTLVYCLCFYLVKLIGVSFLEEYIKKHPGSSYEEIKSDDVGFSSITRYVFYAYFAIQSLYLLGSIYFSRYSFIITTVVGSLVIFAFGFYISRLQDGMQGNWSLVSFTKYDPGVKDGYLLYTISPTVKDMLKYSFQFMWVPLFWVVTWFRLKEKEL